MRTARRTVPQNHQHLQAPHGGTTHTAKRTHSNTPVKRHISTRAVLDFRHSEQLITPKLDLRIYNTFTLIQLVHIYTIYNQWIWFKTTISISLLFFPLYYGLPIWFPTPKVSQVHTSYFTVCHPQPYYLCTNIFYYITKISKQSLMPSPVYSNLWLYPMYTQVLIIQNSNLLILLLQYVY